MNNYLCVWLLAGILAVVSAYTPFITPADLWSIPVSKDEAMEVFNRVYKDEKDFSAAKHSEFIQPDDRFSDSFGMNMGGEKDDNNQKRQVLTVNEALKRFGQSRSLTDLSGTLINSGYITDVNVQQHNTITGRILKKMPLGGGLHIKGKKNDVYNIKIRPGNAFKDTEISLIGSYSLNGYDIPIEIFKRSGEEVYKIIKLDIASKAQTILNLVKKAAKLLSKLLKDLKNVASTIEVIGQHFNHITGSGAFDKDKSQIVITFSKTSSSVNQGRSRVPGTGGGRRRRPRPRPHVVDVPFDKLSIIITQKEDGDDKQSFTLLVEMQDIIKQLLNIGPIADVWNQQASGEVTNDALKLLKGIVSKTKGNACAFVTTDTTEYFDHIKKEKSVCFGSPNGDTFAKVLPGLHFLLEVDYVRILSEDCRIDPNELRNISPLKVYASITKDNGLNIDLLRGLEISFDQAKKCFGQFLSQMPGYWSDGKIVLKELKIEDSNNWKFVVEVKNLALPFPSSEGSHVTVEKFFLDIGKSKGNTKAITSGKVTLGESDFDVSIKYQQASSSTSSPSSTASPASTSSTFTLQVKSKKLTVADILRGFVKLEQGVMDTLGVKDFSLSLTKNQKGLKTFSFRGSPLIFGYEDLSIVGHVEETTETTAKTTYDYGIAVYVNGLNFDTIMETLFGKEMSLKWLDGLKGIVVVTNAPKKFELQNNSRKKVSRPVRPRVPPVRRPVHSDHGAVLYQPRQYKRSANIINETVKHVDTYSPQYPQPAARATIKLKIDDLHSEFQTKPFPIRANVNFGIVWTIPKTVDTCLKNKFCEWMVKNLAEGSETVKVGKHSPNVNIKGYVTSTSFELTATISVSLILVDKRETDPYTREVMVEKLTFTTMKFRLEISTDPKLSLSLSLLYKNTNIMEEEEQVTFTGAIEVTAMSLNLRLSMSGDYIMHKSVPYIKFGDLSVQVGIGVYGLTAFALGATIKLADYSYGENINEIIIKGHFGINPSKPKDNWFYACINVLTLERICNAFNMRTTCLNFPDKVKKSGFPYGIKASYASVEKNVPGIGRIPAGLKIKGTISILEYTVSADLEVNRNKLDLKLELGPINWGNGWIQVTYDKTKLTRGPSVHIILGFKGNPEFSFKINGHINLLNTIQTTVKISVNKTAFFMKLNGDLITGFLSVDIEIFAGTGGSDLFQFKATVQLSFKEKLIKIIKEYLKNLNKKIHALSQQARKSLNDARDKLAERKKKVEGFRNLATGWQEKLELEKERIRTEAKKEQKPCICPKVCFPFMDWNKECWKAWGIWVGCPYWNSCFKYINDIFCMGKCAIKKVAKVVVRWTKQAILTLGQLVLEGAKGLSYLADGIYALADAFLVLADKLQSAILTVVSKALTWATDQLIKMLRNIRINRIVLTAKLTADYSACVGYDYSIYFFEKNREDKGEACLDMKSLSNALLGSVTEKCDETKNATIGEEHFQEFSAEEKENKKTKIQLDADMADADKMSKEKAPPKEIMDAKTDKEKVKGLRKYAKLLEDVPKAPAVSTVPTKSDIEMKRFVEEKIPRYDVKSDPNVRSYVEKSPWGLPNHHIPLGHRKSYQEDPNANGEKRSLHFESNLGPCDKMKRALHGYSDVTDGILKYSDSVQQGVQHAKNRSDHHNNMIEDLRSTLNDTEAGYDMTAREKADAYYVFNHVLTRHEELEKKSSIAMHMEQMHAMPIIRSHINDFLRREKGTNFLNYTDLMHQHAVDGYKRSGIPHPSDVKGEEILENIKQDLQSIVTSEGTYITPMKPRLLTVKRNIITMSEYAKQCKA